MASADISSRKLPPQNLDAEQCVLGAILIDNAALLKVLEVLREGHFYREAHRKIFAAMCSLFERGEPIDILTLTEQLRREGSLERVGGEPYLAALVDSVPTAAAVASHARMVKEKAVLRSLIDAATEIASQSYEATDDVDDLLDRAERVIFEISEDKIQPGFASIEEVLKSTYKTIEELYERKDQVTGVPTGFTDFDEMTAGLHPSELVVIAGRPSTGKTSFALNISRNAAVEKRLTVAIFSLEMSKEQLATRLLCSDAKVDFWKLRTGRISPSEDMPRLGRAAGVLSDAPIFIDDSPALTALDIRAKARRLQAEHGLGLVIVDYLQLIHSRGRRNENRQQEVAEITRSMKELAKELRAPVVVLSQLSRAVEQREDRRPRLADLRESGAIEQDADVVLFIYRDPSRDEKQNVTDFLLGKQRNGPTGSFKLYFSKDHFRFGDLSERYQEYEPS